MNPQKRAFLKAIAAAPEDDVLRLAFADWLQEHGTERTDHQWGEFIRFQVEMAKYPTGMRELAMMVEKSTEVLGSIVYKIEEAGTSPSPANVGLMERFLNLRLIESELVIGGIHQALWMAELPISGMPASDIVWRRGLPEEIRCPHQHWITNGDDILYILPIRRVRFDTSHQECCECPCGGHCLCSVVGCACRWRNVEFVSLNMRAITNGNGEMFVDD